MKTIVKLILVAALSAGALAYNQSRVNEQAKEDVACEVYGYHDGRLCTTGD